MKRVVAIILLLAITLTGCLSRFTIEPPDMGEQSIANDGQPQSEENIDELPKAGKIVVITNAVNLNEEAFLTAEALAAGFGQEHVVHKTWPNKPEERVITDILHEISDDPEVEALVVTNLNSQNRLLVDALKYVRDDIFVVYAHNTHFERPADLNFKADLIIQTDVRRLAENYVMQAKSMGAETIVHYSFPRHMAMPAFAERRDVMKAAAEEEGIRFIELEAPDHEMSHFNIDAGLFITQDLPRQVEALGVNTAFFGTLCGVVGMQIPMISQTIATGAIFVNTCCPSPYYEYPEAIEVEYKVPTGEYDEFGSPIERRLELSELLQVMDEAVEAAGMAGRISCVAVSDSMMWTTIGFMYAVEWLSGNVRQERGVIDLEVLKELAREYMARLGVDAEVALEPLVYNGQAISHYIQGVIDFHVFGII
jgi:hypothetical protein